MASAPYSSSSLALSESKTRVFTTSSSSESSRTSSDPSSEDKSALSPWVAKLEIEDRVTTSEEPSLTTWEKATKGLLANMTGGVVREVLLIKDTLARVTPLWRVRISARIKMDSPIITLSA